jgi:hypothetical protein
MLKYAALIFLKLGCFILICLSRFCDPRYLRPCRGNLPLRNRKRAQSLLNPLIWLDIALYNKLSLQIRNRPNHDIYDTSCLLIVRKLTVHLVKYSIIMKLKICLQYPAPLPRFSSISCSLSPILIHLCGTRTYKDHQRHNLCQGSWCLALHRTINRRYL